MRKRVLAWGPQEGTTVRRPDIRRWDQREELSRPDGPPGIPPLSPGSSPSESESHVAGSLFTRRKCSLVRAETEDVAGTRGPAAEATALWGTVSSVSFVLDAGAGDASRILRYMIS